jgi:hypothetical protein
MDYKYTFKTNRYGGACLILRYNIGEYSALEHGYEFDYELSMEYEYTGGEQPIAFRIYDDVVIRDGSGSTVYNRIFDVPSGSYDVYVTSGEETLIDSGSSYIKCGKKYGDVTLYITTPYNSNATYNYKMRFRPIFTVETTGTYYTFDFKAAISLKDVPVSGVVPTEAPDFDDSTDKLTISYKMPNYYNVSATISPSDIDKVEAGIAFGNEVVPATEEVTVAYREITKFTSSNKGTTKTYTFTLTNDEKTKLLQDAPFVVSQARFYIKTTFDDGLIAYHYIARNFTVTDATPTLAPTVRDINPATLALTGNENVIVKYESNAEYTTGAEAYKEAKIATQLVSNGTQTSRNSFTGVIEGADSNIFTFSAMDTRGENAELLTIEKEFVEYVKLTCNQEIKIELVGESGAKARVKIYGNCYKGSFGLANNQLYLEMRHTLADGTMSDWVNPLGTIPTELENDNTYSLEIEVGGLGSDSAYDFQCRAYDKLNNIETSVYTARLMPVFDWGESDFNFNVPVTAAKTITVDDTVYANNGVEVVGDIEASGNITASGSLEVDGTITTNGYTLPMPYILSATSTNEVVELEDNISNYEYIEIFFTDNNSRGCGYTKIPVLDETFTIDLFLIEASSASSTYIRRTGYICSGNKLTPNKAFGGYMLFNASGVTHSKDEENYINVTKVIGYK